MKAELAALNLAESLLRLNAAIHDIKDEKQKGRLRHAEKIIFSVQRDELALAVKQVAASDQ